MHLFFIIKWTEQNHFYIQLLLLVVIFMIEFSSGLLTENAEKGLVIFFRLMVHLKFWAP